MNGAFSASRCHSVFRRSRQLPVFFSMPQTHQIIMRRVFADQLRKPAIPRERFVSRSAPTDALCINRFLNVETIHLA